MHNESRVNYPYRKAERAAKKRRILFPDVPRSADCTTLSDEMERYTGKESRQRNVCQNMGQAIQESLILKVQDVWQKSP